MRIANVAPISRPGVSHPRRRVALMDLPCPECSEPLALVEGDEMT